jgi:hypothetical protein
MVMFIISGIDDIKPIIRRGRGRGGAEMPQKAQPYASIKKAIFSSLSFG